MRTQSNHGKRASIFLVDDHPLVREALKETLERESDLTVCGEAEDREEAIAAIAVSQPALVIVDLKLKNSEGLELVKDICHRYPKTLTLVLSMHDESVHAERAIRAGACGYISKQASPASILQAVRKILGGEIYWSERAAASVASRSVCPTRCGSEGSATERLSERELQVFQLIGTGFATNQIADSLHIGTSTVEAYRARIKQKLDFKDGPDLLQHAIRWNMARATC